MSSTSREAWPRAVAGDVEGDDLQAAPCSTGTCRASARCSRAAGHLQHVFERLDRHERHVGFHFGRQLGQIRLVARRQMNVLMPCRRAASAFSRMPPTGSTSPLNVISPVIATSSRTA